ncbi:MAG: helix-turn-helix domain-containing protein [Lachnospirales bacterium]
MDIILSRLKELIGDKHGANKELADCLGITGNNITNWKAGRSDAYMKYLPQIADYYNVSLDWLSGRSEQKENPPSREAEGITLDISDLTDENQRKARDYIALLLNSQHKE